MAVFCFFSHSFHTERKFSTRENCHFFSVYWFIQSFMNNCVFMDIHFIWWVIIQCYCYLFYCSHHLKFDIQGCSVWFFHTISFLGLFWVLPYFMPSFYSPSSSHILLLDFSRSFLQGVPWAICFYNLCI